MALSMLGYRCCSDVNELPKNEQENLFGRKKQRVFDAYVNVGSLCGSRAVKLAELYRNAKFIITVAGEEEAGELSLNRSQQEVSKSRVRHDEHEVFGAMGPLLGQLRQLSADALVLPLHARPQWDLLCGFLKCEQPATQYPGFEDLTQRHLSVNGTYKTRSAFPRLTKLQFDSSPWIVTPRSRWDGIPLTELNVDLLSRNHTIAVSERFQMFDSLSWMLLDNTFPSNLALFRPNNFSIAKDNLARLTLRKERSHVRDYTSASICSRRSYLFGRFSTVIKPANVSGLVTGVFLHRNSPRQEIDIEFLGKDTTKLLVNVYYNPGSEGANLEYGYRGTPILIDLGFDASRHFHQYTIEWSPTSIRWLVDGRLAHQRANWEPTPIPHLPMQFYLNLWHSRSSQLAGKLFDRDLPAQTEIRSIDIRSRLDALEAMQSAVGKPAGGSKLRSDLNI